MLLLNRGRPFLLPGSAPSSPPFYIHRWVPILIVDHPRVILILVVAVIIVAGPNPTITIGIAVTGLGRLGDITAVFVAVVGQGDVVIVGSVAAAVGAA